MGRKVAIDFGTTNTVVAEWIETLGSAQIVQLDGISAPPVAGGPPLIPSLLYVAEGSGDHTLVGWAVRTAGYDLRDDPRLFASFKRAIVARHRPLARDLDGEQWDETRAGHRFIYALVGALTQPPAQQQASPTAGAATAVSARPSKGRAIDELVLTVPIRAFERYLAWLTDAAASLPARRLRIVDEPTAAALGYDVYQPGALVMVFDFGGGTLDISLVRTPQPSEVGPGLVYDLGDGVARQRPQRPGRAASPSDQIAVVIAKGGQVLGGDDIDHWLIDDILARNDATRESAAAAYPQLKAGVEAMKIRLSTHHEAAAAIFDPDARRTYRAAYTRAELEELLDRHGFHEKVQTAIDDVLRAARQHGIHKEDIAHVFTVGGTSLMPAVQRIVRMNFGAERVHQDRPFTAVAVGALSVAAGVKLDDYLYHSYGLRHLSPVSGRHEYHEIIPAGTRYPIDRPIELVLCASHKDQGAIELVIGEIEESSPDLVEVYFGERRIVLVESGETIRRVVPLNDSDGARTIARLVPPGRPSEDRVRVEFTVDANRALRVTVTDLLARRVLLDNFKVVELR